MARLRSRPKETQDLAVMRWRGERQFDGQIAELEGSVEDAGAS